MNTLNNENMMFDKIYKIRDWINLDKLNWIVLSKKAIHMMEKNIDKVNWFSLSRNPYAINLLEKNIDKID